MVNKVALVINIIAFALGAAVLVLACIEFKTIYATWSDHRTYTALGPTQVTAGVLIVFSSLLAFPALVSPGMKMIGGVFVLISALFCYAIGIFAAVGAAMKGRVDKVLGCNTQNTGVLNIWQNIDEYFMLAHSLVCSPLCPCDLSTKVYSQYLDNRYTANYISDEFITGDYRLITDNKKFNIESCPAGAIDQINAMFENNPNNTMSSIDYKKFRKYFNYIEEFHECTGWCTTSYTNIFTLKNQHMFKYVFYDLNNSVPKYPGCLNKVLYFVYVFTCIIASFLLFVAVLQTILFLMIMATDNTKYVVDSKPEEEDEENNPRA